MHLSHNANYWLWVYPNGVWIVIIIFIIIIVIIIFMHSYSAFEEMLRRKNVVLPIFLQTEAVKDMEAKLEEHEQNRIYLNQLLSMLRDRDPTLLHVINTSLAQKYVLVIKLGHIGPWKNKKGICSYIFPFPKLSKSGRYWTNQEPWGLAKTIDSDC